MVAMKIITIDKSEKDDLLHPVHLFCVFCATWNRLIACDAVFLIFPPLTTAQNIHDSLLRCDRPRTQPGKLRGSHKASFHHSVSHINSEGHVGGVRWKDGETMWWVVCVGSWAVYIEGGKRWPAIRLPTGVSQATPQDWYRSTAAIHNDKPLDTDTETQALQPLSHLFARPPIHSSLTSFFLFFFCHQPNQPPVLYLLLLTIHPSFTLVFSIFHSCLTLFIICVFSPPSSRPTYWKPPEQVIYITYALKVEKRNTSY